VNKGKLKNFKYDSKDELRENHEKQTSVPIFKENWVHRGPLIDSVDMSQPHQYLSSAELVIMQPTCLVTFYLSSLHFMYILAFF